MLSDGDCYLVSILHNSDLRDWHEYILKQVWGERIFTRQSSRSFGKNKAGICF